MTRRKVGEENVRKIQKSRRSYYVSIPIHLVREFDWQEGQKLVLEKQGDEEILIKDWEES